MGQFAVINSFDGTFHIHRAGCPNVERDEHQANGPHWVTAADNVDDVISVEIEDLIDGGFEEGDFSSSDFRVFPCAHNTRKEL